MRRFLGGVSAGVFAACACGQELLWEVHSQSGVRYGGCYADFGDYDRDGSEDLLVAGTDYRGPFQQPILCVLSGVDGAVLEELHNPYGILSFAPCEGDFDGDGSPDVLLGGGGFIEVWSLRQRTWVLRFPPPVLSGPGGTPVRMLDLNGDGLMDFVFGAPDDTIFAYDHTGVVLYTIPAYAMGFIPTDILAVGDLDRDGADDFLVGAVEWFTGLAYGAVILVSGRTGTPVRVHWGDLPFDALNRDLRRCGDVDGDGILDYAAGNYLGYRGVVKIWSGATGALIREWSDPSPLYLIGLFLAGVDVDLDGRPDILDIAKGYPNVPGQSGLHGRVRMLSSRDGQDLMHVASQQWTSFFGETYANLGVQPGNPYPVFAITDNPVVPPYNLWPRIRAWRCSPPGTRFVGSGCSSTAVQPTIGIRRVDATPSDHSRLVLGSAPENAFAVCVAAPTSLLLAAPVPLDFLGLPGCDLLVAPAITELRLTGAAGMDRGYAAFDFPAAMAATGGVEFAAQWVVLDPVTLDHATTQRYEFRVQ